MVQQIIDEFEDLSSEIQSFLNSQLAMKVIYDETFTSLTLEQMSPDERSSLDNVFKTSNDFAVEIKYPKYMEMDVEMYQECENLHLELFQYRLDLCNHFPTHPMAQTFFQYHKQDENHTPTIKISNKSSDNSNKIDSRPGRKNVELISDSATSISSSICKNRKGLNQKLLRCCSLFDIDNNQKKKRQVCQIQQEQPQTSQTPQTQQQQPQPQPQLENEANDQSEIFNKVNELVNMIHSHQAKYGSYRIDASKVSAITLFANSVDKKIAPSCVNIKNSGNTVVDKQSMAVVITNTIFNALMKGK